MKLKSGLGAFQAIETKKRISPINSTVCSSQGPHWASWKPVTLNSQVTLKDHVTLKRHPVTLKYSRTLKGQWHWKIRCSWKTTWTWKTKWPRAYHKKWADLPEEREEVHGVIEVGSVLDVAAVDIERVTELFCPSRSVRLHRVHVHIDRVRQTIHHVIKVCTQHNIRSVVSLHVQFHHWRPCISGRCFARMERSAVQRHLVDITASFPTAPQNRTFPATFWPGLCLTIFLFVLCFTQNTSSVVKCPCSPLDFMTL